MIKRENKQSLKEIHQLYLNDLFRRCVFISALLCYLSVAIVFFATIANNNAKLSILAVFFFALGVTLVILSSRIPLEHIYELYANSIKVIIKYEYTQKVVLNVAITDCYKKLLYQQLSDAKTLISKNDVIITDNKSKNMILSFRVKGKAGRYYINPTDNFLSRLGDGMIHDISR